MNVNYKLLRGKHNVACDLRQDINALNFLNSITHRLFNTQGDNVLNLDGWTISLNTHPSFQDCTIFLYYQHDMDDETTAIHWVFKKTYDSFVLDDSFEVYFSTWGDDDVQHQKMFQYISSDFVYYVTKRTKTYFTEIGLEI